MPSTSPYDYNAFSEQIQYLLKNTGGLKGFKANQGVFQNRMRQLGVPDADRIFQDFSNFAPGTTSSSDEANFQRSVDLYLKNLGKTGANNPYDNLIDQSKQVYDPQNVNQIYNAMIGAIGRLGGSAAASARRSAGAQAGAAGLANPGAYTSAVASRALQPFNQASTQAETGRAQDLYGAQQKQLGYETQINRYRTADDFQQQGLDLSRDQLGEYQRQFNERMKQLGPNWMTYLSAFLPLLGATGTGGASLLGNILYPSTLEG